MAKKTKAKKKTRGFNKNTGAHTRVREQDKQALGRPSKFTEENREIIYKALHECPFLSNAAGVVGISRAALDCWLRQGAKDDEDGYESEYAIFLRKVRQLRSRAEGAIFQTIKNEASSNWMAARYVLQCMDHKTYGQKQTVKHEDENTKNPDTESESLHAQIAKVVAKHGGE